MSETTANAWTLPETTLASHMAAERIRQRFRAPGPRGLSPAVARLLNGLILGAFAAAAATALAAAPIGTAVLPKAEAAAPAEQSIPGYALDHEWRSYRTPVQVDRMFRRSR